MMTILSVDDASWNFSKYFSLPRKFSYELKFTRLSVRVLHDIVTRMTGCVFYVSEMITKAFCKTASLSLIKCENLIRRSIIVR